MIKSQKTSEETFKSNDLGSKEKEKEKEQEKRKTTAWPASEGGDLTEQIEEEVEENFHNAFFTDNEAVHQDAAELRNSQKITEKVFL